MLNQLRVFLYNNRKQSNPPCACFFTTFFSLYLSHRWKNKKKREEWVSIRFEPIFLLLGKVHETMNTYILLAYVAYVVLKKKKIALFFSMNYMFVLQNPCFSFGACMFFMIRIQRFIITKSIITLSVYVSKMQNRWAYCFSCFSIRFTFFYFLFFCL